MHFVIQNTRQVLARAVAQGRRAVSKRTPLIKPGKSATLTVNLEEGDGLDLVPGSRSRTLGHEGVTRRRIVARRRFRHDADTTTTTYNPPPVPGY